MTIGIVCIFLVIFCTYLVVYLLKSIHNSSKHELIKQLSSQNIAHKYKVSDMTYVMPIQVGGKKSSRLNLLARALPFLGQSA